MSKAYNLSLTWIIDSNGYKKRVKLTLCDVFCKTFLIILQAQKTFFVQFFRRMRWCSKTTFNIVILFLYCSMSLFTFLRCYFLLFTKRKRIYSYNPFFAQDQVPEEFHLKYKKYLLEFWVWIMFLKNFQIMKITKSINSYLILLRKFQKIKLNKEKG